MAFRVNTNVPSIRAQRNLDITQRKVQKSLAQLATGKRIVSASDDAAGLAVAQQLKAQQSGITYAKRNAQEAKAFIQAAEGSLNEQNNILIRLRELAIQSASDTVDDREREYLEKEYVQLTEEIERIANVTSFRGHNLLRGEYSEFDFHVGPNGSDNDRIRVEIEIDSTTGGLDVDSLSVADQDDALDSLESLDEAIQRVNGFRADLGSYQRRLEHADNRLSLELESTSEARSIIEDTDYAEATSEVVKNQILSEASISVLAQSNGFNGRAVRLIDLI